MGLLIFIQKIKILNNVVGQFVFWQSVAVLQDQDGLIVNRTDEHLESGPASIEPVPECLQSTAKSFLHSLVEDKMGTGFLEKAFPSPVGRNQPPIHPDRKQQYYLHLVKTAI